MSLGYSQRGSAQPDVSNVARRGGAPAPAAAPESIFPSMDGVYVRRGEPEEA